MLRFQKKTKLRKGSSFLPFEAILALSHALRWVGYSVRTSSALKNCFKFWETKTTKDRWIGATSEKVVTFHSSPGWWTFRKFLGEFLTWLSRGNGSLSGSIRWTWNQRPKRLKIWNSKKSQRGFVSCILTISIASSTFWLKQSYFQLRDETIHASGPFAAEGHFFAPSEWADFRDTNMLQVGCTSNQEQKDLLETSIWRALHISVNLFGPKNGSTSYAFLAQWMFMNAVSHLDGPEALGFQNDDIKISMQTTSNNYRHHSQHEESWR